MAVNWIRTGFAELRDTRARCVDEQRTEVFEDRNRPTTNSVQAIKDTKCCGSLRYGRGLIRAIGTSAVTQELSVGWMTPDERVCQPKLIARKTGHPPARGKRDEETNTEERTLVSAAGRRGKARNRPGPRACGMTRARPSKHSTMSAPAVDVLRCSDLRYWPRPGRGLRQCARAWTLEEIERWRGVTELHLRARRGPGRGKRERAVVRRGKWLAPAPAWFRLAISSPTSDGLPRRWGSNGTRAPPPRRRGGKPATKIARLRRG